MKKSVFIAAAFAALCGLATTGCGGSSSSNNENAAGGKKDAGVSITFLNSKGEIQEALEKTAAAYTKATGVKLEIVACGAGEVPYTKITTMYNSGTPPTMAMLDTTDVVALANEYALDLSGEKWVSEISENQLTKIGGKLYSFPFCIEGRGIIYNKAAIEKTLGRSFDPSSINSYAAFKAILEELASKGMSYPVVLSKEDWSLGAHQLGFIYDTYDGTTDGASKIMSDLKGGLDPATYPRYTAFLDTLDLLVQYNIAHTDPLGADYDEGALQLASGEAAFWANGCWAWPNLAEGGAKATDAFGFIPFVLGDDTSDFANTGIQASATKQVMLDKVRATPEQQQAAKDFLNYLVYEAEGQKALVNDCAIIPAANNNPNKPLDPLGADIVTKMGAGNTFSSSFIAPSDHWSKMGAALQKYISGNSSRDEFTKSLSDYWKAQK